MANDRVTILVENTAGRGGVLGEHGLSFWIELDGQDVLFDTGQGDALIHNVGKLGVPLERARAIVLSHGHYDHTGSLGDALASTGRVPLYAHPAAFAPKFARNSDGTSRSIGLPDLDESAVRERAELTWVTTPTQVTDRLWLTGPVPRVTDFEDTGGPFYLDAACTTPDPIEDDQAAYFDTPEGLIVLLGCAHAGVVNTLRHIRSLTGDRPIHTVVGGMHLVQAGAERMRRTIDELRRFDIRRLMPCHCTGPRAIAELWQAFPGACCFCHAGLVLAL